MLQRFKVLSIGMALGLLAGIVQANCIKAGGLSQVLPGNLACYTTFGIWSGQPWGTAVRAGLAVPLSNPEDSVVFGIEESKEGQKQFIGYRSMSHEKVGPVNGSIELAHWKAGNKASDVNLGAEYWGIETNLHNLRIGVRGNAKGKANAKFTFGFGWSY